MATSIRLTKIGRRNKPFYRIIVTDKAAKRNSKALDVLGFINPGTKPHQVKIDNNKLKKWMSQGAKPSETLRKLIDL